MQNLTFLAIEHFKKIADRYVFWNPSKFSFPFHFQTVEVTVDFEKISGFKGEKT